MTLALAQAWCRLESLSFHGLKRTHAVLLRVVQSTHRLVGGIFCECLNSDEKSRLTVKIYDFYPGYMEVGDSLYAAEEAWFGQQLPAPPCHVLVGACGTGREAIALAARGYRVDAFEPAPAFVAESRRRLSGRAPVAQLSYEDLSSLVLDGLPAAAGCELALDYGAVVLGCGSLTHVLEPIEQHRLLAALVRLCPRGPILASFFCSGDSLGAGPPEGRAVRLGRRIGRAFARVRRMPPASVEQVSYRAHSGFTYTFTEREIEALGAAVGRCVAWEQQAGKPSHYATFLPPHTSA